MKIHFIGIGGIGISALAQFCKQQGHKVSGSEVQKTGIYKILKEQGIEVKIPQKAGNIPQDCDLVVYTEAIGTTNLELLETTEHYLFSDGKIGTANPEFLEARKRNIPIKSYFEFLGKISQKFRTIAVAGTHGKTTTTGLLSAGFKKAGFGASVFIGSKLKEFNNSNFFAGTNDFLLVEACEYRNNFRFLCPEIVILTGIELDHVDFYRDEDHYLQTFSDFCDKAKVVIFHENDQKAQKVLKNFKGQKIAVSNEKINDLNLNISGTHNRKNALLALACAEYLKQEFSFSEFRTGMESFSGAWRRQEFLGEKILNTDNAEAHKILVFDDYGHHPTEIKATLQGFRERFPEQCIGLIFEPHQFSRTKQFFKSFLSAFELADLTGIFPIYEARDTQADKDSISIDHFICENPEIQKIESLSDAEIFAQNLLQKGITQTRLPLEKVNPVLLFMGAGKIDVFAKEFLK